MSVRVPGSRGTGIIASRRGRPGGYADDSILTQGDNEKPFDRVAGACPMKISTAGAKIGLLVIDHLLKCVIGPDDIERHPCNTRVVVEPKGARSARG